MTINGDASTCVTITSDTIKLKPLLLEFNNIHYGVNTAVSKKHQYILNGTCGKFKSGRLGAILGPSGAGKTTLMNVLSGFKYKTYTGSIKLNNEERNTTDFMKISSYIAQDFPLFSNLTVWETLKVSIDLKLGTTVTEKGKISIMGDVLKLLNMEKCINTLAGKLSGGEKKRLSIAVELVTNPPIMFFDEPTSGLDSVASLQIVNYLRSLAQSGRIIVCVIHQPSSRILNLFEDILVMSEGKTLYCGPRSQMIDYFESAGYACPTYYNPADYVLEVASGEHGSSLDNLFEMSRKCCEELFPPLPTDEYDEHCDMVQLKMLGSKDLNPLKFKKSLRKYPVDIWSQFLILTRRSFRSMWRDLLTVQLRVIVHLLVGILLGIVYFDIGDDASKVLSNASCLFFCTMFIFFGNALPSIISCPMETSVFIREHLNGWYTIGAYYFAKLVADLPLQFICPTLFSAVMYYMTGQPADFGRFLMFWGIGLLTAIMGNSLGLVFGSAFTMQLAVFLVPGICIPMFVFSGFFIRLNELSSFLRPIADVSFFRYTLEGNIQSIYGYNRSNLTCTKDFCYFRTAKKFLKDMDMEGDLFAIDLIAIIIVITLLNILFYISLVIRIKRAQ